MLLHYAVKPKASIHLYLLKNLPERAVRPCVHVDL